MLKSGQPWDNGGVLAILELRAGRVGGGQGKDPVFSVYVLETALLDHLICTRTTCLKADADSEVQDHSIFEGGHTPQKSTSLPSHAIFQPRRKSTSYCPGTDN